MRKRRAKRKKDPTTVYERAESYRWRHTRTRALATPVTITFTEPTTQPGTRAKRLARLGKARSKGQG